MMEKEFTRITIDPLLFQIENVADDNACLYRALANGMNYRTRYSKSKINLGLNASNFNSPV